MVDYGLAGQVALITGGGRGLGKGVAFGLAEQGVAVVIADIMAEGEQAVAEIKAQGGMAGFIRLDVGEADAVGAAVKQIVNQYGRLDILINNAGISPKKDGKKVPVIEMDRQEWEHVVRINLNGAFYCAQACARVMVRQKHGHIINMASLAGKTYSAIPAAHYLATKAGLIGLTRALAGELAASGITVNAIAPGRMATEMILSVPDEVNQEYLKKIPVGRLGTARDIADAVLFLVSDRAGFITGVTLDVNGGSTIF